MTDKKKIVDFKEIIGSDNTNADKQPSNKSLDNVHKYLENQVIIGNCEVEIEVFVARLTRRTNRLQRYFNSTPLRQTFARILVLGKCVNRLYTISEIADRLQATRQSIAILVNECEEEGWAYVVRNGNRVQFQATDELYEAHKEYVKWRMELSQKYMKSRYMQLYEFEKLMQTALTYNTEDNVKSDDIDNHSYIFNITDKHGKADEKK